MAISPSSVLAAEQRAWHYWFADGLPTLVAGVGCLLLAVCLGYDHTNDSSPFTMALALVGLFLYGAVLLFQSQIIEWLKIRITYPRTGYTNPPYFADETSKPVNILALSMQRADTKLAADIERLRKDRTQRLLLACVVVALAAAAMMFIQNRWICAVAGVVLALAVWIWGRKDQHFSWVVLGGFPFMGFILAIFFADHIPGLQRVIYFLGAAGVIFILDGALSLFRYLRQNPLPRQTEV